MRPAINAKQAKQKDAYLQKHYHITLEFYDRLRIFQDFKCYICRTHENHFKNGMAVDHDHKTGEVRGLLCWKCNRAIGRWEDDHDKLQRAAEYVTLPPVFVLAGVKIFTAPGRIGTAVRAKALAKLNGQPAPKRRKRAKRKSGKSSAGRSKRTVKI
jgi:hypothetical protein